MPDNTIEDVPANNADVQSDATNTVPADIENSSTAHPQHARLAESELESSLSDVLPLSPIGNSDSEKSASEIAEKKSNTPRGLRRGASGKGKSAGTTPTVGIVENPAEFTETLSGPGPKPSRPREQFRNRSDRFERPRRERRDADRAPEENAEDGTEDFEATKPGNGWSLQEKRERNNFRHLQSNVGDKHPKLIIEPAQIPEQEREPSFWEKLKGRILAFFKINKKKNKKRGGKNRNKKFRQDRRDDKNFRPNGNRHSGGGYNRNRYRNSSYRGNRKSGGNRPQGGGEKN